MKPSSHSIAFGAADDLVVLAAGDDGQPADWVRLMPIGRFAGRDGRGPYVVEDLAHAQQIVAESARRLNNLDPVVDYDHQTDLAAVSGVGGKAPASGWIKEMQARADGIWGRIEWTAQAADELKAKAYRYLSPVFPHEKVTGRVSAILRAALTNKPNLDLGALASMSAHPGDDDLDKTKLAQALGLDAAATEDQIHAAITGLKARGDGVSAIALAAGLQADAPSADIITAMAASATTATPDPAKFVPIETVLALQSQINAGAADQAKAQAVADVEKGVAEGRIAPALKDNMIALASSNRAAFDDFMSKAPVIVQPGEAGKTAPASGKGGVLTVEELAVCSSMGLTEDEFLAAKPKEA